MSEQNQQVAQVAPKQTAVSIVDRMNQTPALQLASMPDVRERWIKNYNLTHKGGMGEMAYARQLMYFMQKLTDTATGLSTCTGFSLYSCFQTCAVKGYSLDAADKQAYMVAFGGKAQLLVQAEAHITRLIETKQIADADGVQLVYEGDLFEVNMGKVERHVPANTSDKIIAGYIRFYLNTGRAKDFIYYPKNWNDWKRDSKNKDGANWNSNGQPRAGFLKKKITKHAACDGSWGSGSVPVTEIYEDVEVDADDVETNQQPRPAATITINQPAQPTAQTLPPPYVAEPQPATTGYKPENIEQMPESF